MTTLENAGFVWLRKALDAQEVSTLSESISWSSLYGTRAIILNTDLRIKLTQLIEPLLPNAKIIRLAAFNKTAENNWTLPWHQDRVVVARKKTDDLKFTNWTRKSHYWHCEPPIEYLGNMLFARIYLDDAGTNTGDIQLAQGSHKFGKIPHANIETVLSTCPTVKCNGQVGDVLIVKALTLHRSGKSQSAAPRKALRVDFSNNVKICKLVGL